MIGLTSTQSAASTASRIQRVLSPGGVEAWLIEEHAVPLVALAFSFAGGAAEDPPGRAGLANVMARLLDEGAGDLDAQAFQERLDDHAIEMSFAAGRDRIDGSLKTLVRHKDEAFRLLALALAAPRFDEDAVARVKGQVTAGLKRQMNDPAARSMEAWAALGFAGHPYGRPVAGTIESVGAVGRADVAAAAGRMLVRRGLKVSIVGAITATEAAVMLDQVFAGLPEGEDEPPAEVATLGGLGAVEVVPLDIPQSTIRFGSPGLLRRDPDFVAATIVNHILGGGAFTARLWQSVRETRGLAYSVSSSLQPYRRAGVFIGGTATKNERAREALEVIRAEVARMGADGPTEEELVKAKKFLIGSYALAFDTSSKIARQLDGIQVNDLGIDYVARRNAEFEAVTLEDAKRVARRLFADGRLLVAVAGKPEGF